MRVGLHARVKRGVAARNAEVQGGTHLQNVLDHGLEALRRRAAAVDMEGAAVHEQHVEDEVAAEGMVPGQEVDGDLVGADEGPELGDAHLVGGLHAVGDFDALGQVGGAGGELDLGEGLRVTAAKRASPSSLKALRRSPASSAASGCTPSWWSACGDGEEVQAAEVPIGRAWPCAGRRPT